MSRFRFNGARFIRFSSILTFFGQTVSKFSGGPDQNFDPSTFFYLLLLFSQYWKKISYLVSSWAKQVQQINIWMFGNCIRPAPSQLTPIPFIMLTT